LEKFRKILWKKMEKSLKTRANSKGTCFFCHNMSDTFLAFLFARTFADMTSLSH
jgi:hypothetical protein